MNRVSQVKSFKFGFVYTKSVRKVEAILVFL